MKEITLEQAVYANQKLFSDTYPFEIVRKISDKTIEVREMKAVLIEGNYDNQSWKYNSEENNPIIKLRLRKKGGWKDKKGIRYNLDVEPMRYHDYSF